MEARCLPRSERHAALHLPRQWRTQCGLNAIRGNQRQSEAIRDNGGLNADDVMKAKALGIDAQIAAEIHVGAGGGLDEAAHLFARHPDFHQSAVNRRRGYGEVAWYMYTQALSEGG